MKKLQLKVSANKNRLQINRPKHENVQGCELKIEPFKENLSIYSKLQQKEGRTCKIQRLPSVHSPSLCQPVQPPALQRIPLQSRKKISISLQPGKQMQIRRSASIELYNKSQNFQGKQQDLSEAIKELIRLFECKRLNKGNGNSLASSSADLPSILRYIISRKNIREISKSDLSTNQLKQQTNYEFAAKKVRKSSFADEFQTSSKKHLKICSNIVDITSTGSQFSDADMLELRQELNRLRLEKKGHQMAIDGLKEHIEEQQIMLHDLLFQKQQLSQQISCGSSKLKGIELEIQEKSGILEKASAKRQEIQDFIHSQPNRIARQASQYHKNLQIDLFEYADYLRHHPHGKKEFQPSIYYDEIQRMMGVELKQMIKSLTEDKKQKCEKKCEQLLKFVERLKHQYKLMNNQLHQVIEQKTKYIQKFSSIMFMWYENYLTKKEYLSNLKEGFSLETVKIEEGNRRISEIEKNSACAACRSTKNEVSKLMESVEKVIQLFGLGNSFY